MQAVSLQNFDESLMKLIRFGLVYRIHLQCNNSINHHYHKHHIDTNIIIITIITIIINF